MGWVGGPVVTCRHLTLRPGSRQMGRAEVWAADVRAPGEGAFGESPHAGGGEVGAEEALGGGRERTGVLGKAGWATMPSAPERAVQRSLKDALCSG